MIDNHALHAACLAINARVLVVFIATPKQWHEHDMAPCQEEFIYASLQQLKRELAQKGIPLYYHECDNFADSVDWIIHYCIRQEVAVLFYNRQYELNERRRDEQVEQRLSGCVRCQHFDDSLLLPPGSVNTSSGKTYKVYTPFRNAFIRRLTISNVSCYPAPKQRGNSLLMCDSSEAYESITRNLPADFPIGEQAALQRLRIFCRGKAQDYLILRDLPAITGTSSLSPYLAIGTLSPRQCFNYLRAEHPGVLKECDSGPFSWLNELIWREFYRNLIIAYPMLCKRQPFIAWTNKICWRNNAYLFQAWKEGKTGYPIVDSAMRQLNSTAWMHNRLRMITANFLVKDLLIDWRAGERYFMSKLLDGDFASNNGGWQWAASTGTDAVPYFRMFNPINQGKKFDPYGIFTRKWLPELANVPNHAIHQPHDWAKKHNLVLDYPLPIVDHQESRRQTIAVFKAAKSAGSEENKKEH